MRTLILITLSLFSSIVYAWDSNPANYDPLTTSYSWYWWNINHWRILETYTFEKDSLCNSTGTYYIYLPPGQDTTYRTKIYRNIFGQISEVLYFTLVAPPNQYDTTARWLFSYNSFGKIDSVVYQKPGSLTGGSDWNKNRKDTYSYQDSLRINYTEQYWDSSHSIYVTRYQDHYFYNPSNQLIKELAISYQDSFITNYTLFLDGRKSLAEAYVKHWNQDSIWILRGHSGFGYDLNNFLIEETDTSFYSDGEMRFGKILFTNNADGLLLDKVYQTYDDSLLVWRNSEKKSYTYCSLSVSAVKEVSVSDFDVYPNPASSKVNIRFTSNCMLKVEVYNLIGNLIFSKNCYSNFELNTTDWQKGMYYIKIQNSIKRLVIE